MRVVHTHGLELSTIRVQAQPSLYPLHSFSHSRNDKVPQHDEEDVYAAEDESEALAALGLPCGFGSQVRGQRVMPLRQWKRS